MAFFDAFNLPRQQPIMFGINNQSMPGGESTLDIQCVTCLLLLFPFSL
jgi:hypothetical protein